MRGAVALGSDLGLNTSQVKAVDIIPTRVPTNIGKNCPYRMLADPLAICADVEYLFIIRIIRSTHLEVFFGLPRPFSSK